MKRERKEVKAGKCCTGKNNIKTRVTKASYTIYGRFVEKKHMLG